MNNFWLNILTSLALLRSKCLLLSLFCLPFYESKVWIRHTHTKTYVSSNGMRLSMCVLEHIDTSLIHFPWKINENHQHQKQWTITPVLHRYLQNSVYLFGIISFKINHSRLLGGGNIFFRDNFLFNDKEKPIECLRFFSFLFRFQLLSILLIHCVKKQKNKTTLEQQKCNGQLMNTPHHLRKY